MARKKRSASIKEWQSKEKLKLIEDWYGQGLSIRQIAKNMGCNPATIYKWREKYDYIDEAFKKGAYTSVTEVENALYKKAVGYESEYEKVDAEGNTIKYTKKFEPDLGAIIFFLRNRGFTAGESHVWNNRDRAEIDKVVAEKDLTEAKIADIEVNGYAENKVVIYDSWEQFEEDKNGKNEAGDDDNVNE